MMPYYWMQQEMPAQPALSGLGQLGSALRRLGAVAGLGTMDLTTGVQFQNDDAYKDFVSGVELRGSAGTWSGLPSSVLMSLRQAITSAGASLDVRLITLVEQFKQTAQAYVSQLDQLQKFGFFGRSESQDLSYRQTMDLLKAEILKFLQSYQNVGAGGGSGGQTSTTASSADPTNVASVNTAASNVQSIIDQLMANQAAAAEAAAAEAAAQQMAAQQQGSGLPWPLIIGVGGVGLVALVLLTKKKGGG